MTGFAPLSASPRWQRTGLWESGHGDAWRADAVYIEAHEAVLAATLLR